VLAQIDRVRTTPAVAQAHVDAPSAYALAETLRRRARRELDDDDFAGAQIVGERALAAYQRAVALGRVARADAQRVALEARVAGAEKRVARLDRAHQQVAADIAAVEARLRLVHNLEAPQPTGKASPRREQARAQAVQTLQLQASLLCGAARLLVASRRGEVGFRPPAAVDQAAGALAELDAALATKLPAAPIDQARRVRAGCLAALTAVRRTPRAAGTVDGSADALLDALAAVGQGRARRDDRGAVLTLWSAFSGDGLSPAGERAAKAVAAIAGKHPGVPLMIVLHQRRPLDASSSKRQRQRGAALVQRLERLLGGRALAPATLAGSAAPLVDPAGPHANRNERVELVFVTGGAG